MGKPEQVRLSEAEKALAITLGQGVLAKGVRTALEQAMQAQNEQALRAMLNTLAGMLADGKNIKDIDPNVLKKRLLQLFAAEKALRRGPSTHSLSPEDQETACDLGEGDIERGISIALSAARFLGHDTTRKFNHHGTGHNI